MQDEQIDRSLALAIAALGTISAQEMQHLPLHDRALMLSALPASDELHDVRQQFAQSICPHLSTTWITEGETDEVFAVLAALWQYDSTYVTGEYLMCVVQRLIKCEATVGGPYYSGSELCARTNAHIAIFMRLIARPLPKLDRFLADIITTQRFSDTKLASTYLLYLLAQASDSPQLAQYVAQHWLKKDWQLPWRKAVALRILQNKLQTFESRGELLTLCQAQQRTGFWGGKPPAKGSLVRDQACFITTALIVAALFDFRHPATQASLADLRHRQRIVARTARRAFAGHTEPLRSSGLAMVQAICQRDINFEITLLAHFFAHAVKMPVIFNESCCTILGPANMLGWIAYLIYDDFLDDEGKGVHLPVANVAMRAALDYFRMALPGGPSFQRYINKVFNIMDQANAWEVRHCRFIVQAGNAVIARLPRYGRGTMLAERSLAHSLGPMAIVMQCLPHDLKKTRSIETAFRHYLIAKQLADDIHDWVKDMQAGQLSYVVVAILRDMRLKSGTYQLSVLIPAMQHCFGRTTAPKQLRLILRHVTLSRRFFIASQLLRSPNEVYGLLDRLENSTKQSLDHQVKAQSFRKSLPH